MENTDTTNIGPEVPPDFSNGEKVEDKEKSDKNNKCS